MSSGSPSTGKVSLERRQSETTTPLRPAPEPSVDSSPYPNTWAKIRHNYLRDAVSEALGTALLVIFGSGAGCQAVASASRAITSSPKGDALTVAFGYAVGIGLGAWAAGVSGSHINPAVTIALATFRRFPWKRVPLYVFSQVLGGCFGTLIVYGNYVHVLSIVDPEKTVATAGIFAAYGLDVLPAVACFFSEFLGTAFLVLTVFAITDKANPQAIPNGLVPLVLFIVLLGAGVSLGMETSFGINPARDFGPRLALSMVGYSRHVIWNYRSQYWLWTGILAPISGGLIGGGFYDLFIYTGSESIFNYPTTRFGRKIAHGPEGSEENV